MKTFRNFLIVIACLISLALSSGIILWQYFESKKEISYFRKEMFRYEEFYLKDRRRLKDKNRDDLTKLIDAVDKEIDHLALYLPQKNYLGLYNHFNSIKALYEQYGATFTFENIEVSSKDFYEILNVYAISNGNPSNIAKATQEIKEKVKLIDFYSICSEGNASNDDILVKMNFNLYVFHEPLGRAGKGNRINRDSLGEGYKTWLPPFSSEVKRSYERLIALRKLEISMSDQKEKLELFGELQKKRESLQKTSMVFEHLMKLGAENSNYLSFPISIKNCEGN